MPKRFYKKRRFKRRRSGIAKIKRQLKALSSHQELKYWDYNDSGDVINITAKEAPEDPECLNVITQGTTSTTRIGDKISAKRCTIHGYISGTALTEDAIIRVVVFRSKQNNNALADWGDLFQDSTDSTVTSFRRWDTKKLYKVYSDQTYTMGVAADEGVTSLIPFNINIKLKNNVHYTANTGAVTDIRTNAMYIICCSNVAGANWPTVSFKSRFTYYDS